MAWDRAEVVATRSVKKTMATTGSAPTGDDGILIDVLKGFALRVEADGGQTLSGTGNLRCWVWDRVINAWRKMPNLDVAIPAVASGQAGIALPALEVFARRGRIAFITDGVGVSAGSVTIYMLASDISDREL